MKTNNKWSGPLITTLVMLSIIGISKGVWIYFDQQNSKSNQLQGLTISREAYVANCVREATSGNDATTKELATPFCGCAYDQGVQKYGIEKYMNMDAELSRTNVVTPEINEIINKCLVEIGG